MSFYVNGRASEDNYCNIYFINLKFTPYDRKIKDEKSVQIIIYPSDINISMDNYEFITGKKLTDDSGIIHIPSSPKSFINTFDRIDSNDYLVNLILSLFNCEYSHGTMRVPSISFTKNYENN